jgi:hypothetical protein
MLELVHFLKGMLLFGPASGFSTETGECGLKQWEEAPTITAQKRNDILFSKQVCARIHERRLIDGIANAQPLEEEAGEVGTNQSTKVVEARCAIFLVEEKELAHVVRVLSSGRRHKLQINFPAVIEAWFETQYLDTDGEMDIQLYTEIVLPGQPGQPGTVLRARPNYQSDGPWYDYALVSYVKDNHEFFSKIQ